MIGIALFSSFLQLAYNDFINVKGRDLLDVLKALPSAMPPLDLLLEMLPRLQVRYYSISSSPKVCCFSGAEEKPPLSSTIVVCQNA